MDRASRVYFKRAIRRTLAWVALPAALLLGFRLYWGYHAQNRLAATLAHLRALHIRYTPEDFPDGASVPAEQNAVNALLSGPLAFRTNSANEKLINDPLEYQTPNDRAVLMQLLADEQKRLDRIDEAARRPIVAWPRAVLDPAPRPSLYGMVAFGHLLEKCARIAHEQHDDTQALRQLGRLLAVARVMGKSPILLHVLVANVYRDIAADGIDQLQENLDLRDPAVVLEARHLVDLLTNDTDLQWTFAYAFEGEVTVNYIDSKHFTQLDDLEPKYFAWVLEPLAYETWARSTDRWAAMITASRAPNYPEFVRLSKQAPPDPTHGNRLDLWANAADFVGGGRVWDRNSEGLKKLMHAQCSAMLLAARIYAAENGKLSATASDLVPAILPHLPIDPYLEGEQPLRYRLDAGGPTVWSVGENGQDDGGDKKKDMVFGAANLPEAPPPPAKPHATKPRPTSRAATSRAAPGH